jgi:hypothetical protein
MLEHWQITFLVHFNHISVETEMKTGKILLNLATFSGISILIAICFYFVNVRFFSSIKYFSSTDAFFIEGMILLLCGILLLLGRGGINLWSQKAAILSALAGAVYDEDTIGPNEILRKDRWKPEGFTRLALILILAGVFMLIIYFLAL